MSFLVIFLDLNQDLGTVLVVLVIAFFAIGFLWVEFVENPKQEREKRELERRWREQEEEQDQEYLNQSLELKSNKSPIIYSKTLLEEKVYDLSNSVPSCKKCGEDIFTIWEINNSTLTIRCNGCKKKYIIKNDDVEKDFVKDLNTTYNHFLGLLENINPYLDQYKDHSYDFTSLRSNFPKCRAITFESNGEELESLIDSIPSDEPSRRISDNVKDRVWNRDSGKCVMCGTREKLEFDHIIPFSKGGSNGYRNIQLLCEECNRKKSNNIG